MKSMKKIYLALAITPLLLTPQPKVQANPAICAFAALAACFIVDGIQDSRTLVVLNDAQKRYDNLSKNLEKELSCMGYLCNNTNQLKYNINQRYNNEFPYLSFEKQLSQAISDIRETTTLLLIKKKELCNQKNLLFDECQIKWYKRKINRFTKLNSRLRSLCYWLEQLKKTVINFPEHPEEKKLNPSLKNLKLTPLEPNPKKAAKDFFQDLRNRFKVFRENKKKNSSTTDKVRN